MKYNLSKSYDKQKAMEYLKKLSDSDSKAEVKKIHGKRSTSQNSYLHVLFSLWGSEFGYTLEESKQTVKTALSYTYTKTRSDNLGKSMITFMAKTSSMDSKELTTFIDKFRNWSADTCGLYLPSSEEYIQEQIYFDNQLENTTNQN